MKAMIATSTGSHGCASPTPNEYPSTANITRLMARLTDQIGRSSADLALRGVAGA